ncbi:MAG: VCBS repeat-containing protein [bacterium]|nr:VCBS repeat-containing protein [bacterium]
MTSLRSCPTVVLTAAFAAILLSWATELEAAANPDLLTGFPVTLDGALVRNSPVALGDVDGDGIADIVVGGSDGKVHAYTGTGTELWTYDTGDMAIEGKAAIGDIDGDTFNEVVIGAGSTFTAKSHGGLYVIDHLGNLQCSFPTLDDGDSDSWREGVYASPALADIDGDDGGRLEIIFGAWDRYVRVLHDDCTALWENWVIDTVWSSPAIGDLNRDGQLDVVIGGDSGEVPPQFPYREDGGLLYAFDGATGAELEGFPIQIDEVIWSSPALADLDKDGWLEIIVGTGYCWPNPACAPGGDTHPGVGQYLNVWDHEGNYFPGWPVITQGHYVFASPAIADLDEDGELEIIVNTQDPDDNQGGLVYAFNSDGTTLQGWPVQPETPVDTQGGVRRFQTGASPVVADIDGDDHLEVLLPSNWDVVVWDRYGNQLSRGAYPLAPDALILKTEYALSAGVGVGDVDGDNDLEVVAAGADANPPTAGALYAWDFSSGVGSAQPWPLFRHNTDNRAWIDNGTIFADGFESGDTAGWSSATP